VQSTAGHTPRFSRKGVLCAVLLLGSLAHLVSTHISLKFRQHLIETTASEMLIETTPLGCWVVANDDDDEDEDEDEDEVDDDDDDDEDENVDAGGGGDDDSYRRCGRFVGKIKPDKARVVGLSLFCAIVNCWAKRKAPAGFNS